MQQIHKGLEVVNEVCSEILCEGFVYCEKKPAPLTILPNTEYLAKCAIFGQVTSYMMM